jgi:lipopolysaccharide export LptBFGC system permease protein LptF
MKTLDRYLVRSFLGSALVLGAAILALRIVADLFFNMDEFLEKQDGLVNLLYHIGVYYSYQSLAYFNELGGVIIIVAASFTLARMNHTNELTAMLASGVSLHRVIVPIITIAVLLGGLIVLDRELLIPPNAARLVRTRDQAEQMKRFAVNLLSDTQGTVWLSPTFDPATGQMSLPIVTIRDEHKRRLATAVSNGTARRWTFVLPGKSEPLPGWNLTAAAMSRAATAAGAWENVPTVRQIFTAIGPSVLLRATRKPDTRRSEAPVALHPQTLRQEVAILPIILDERYAMTIHSMAEAGQPQLVIGSAAALQERTGRLNRPAFVFRMPEDVYGREGRLLGVFHADSATWVPAGRDAATKRDIPSHWLLENGQLFVPSDLTEEDLVLRQSSRWLDYMSYAQLTQLLKLDRVPDRRGAEMARHVRFADPVNNLVMLLLVLPFILSRERNIKASASLSVLIGGTYFAFVYACRLIGLPPMIGAFLPIATFGPISVIMLDSVKT